MLLVTDVILGYIKSGRSGCNGHGGLSGTSLGSVARARQVALMLELMVCTCLASAACMVQGLVLAHDGDTDWGCCVCMNSPGAKHALVWLQGLSGSSAVVQAGDTSQGQQHTGPQPLDNPFRSSPLKDHAVVMSWTQLLELRRHRIPPKMESQAPCTWYPCY